MLIVLSGPPMVGKSYAVEHLAARHGFGSCTPFTTRPARTSEVEGRDYCFRSAAELAALSSNFIDGYWATPLPDGHIYGYPSSVRAHAVSRSPCVIQAHTTIALRLRTDCSVGSVALVFMDFADVDTMEVRLAERFGRDNDAFRARLALATSERAAASLFDEVLQASAPAVMTRLVVATSLRLISSMRRDALTPSLD
jgi:guanylate kinase